MSEGTSGPDPQQARRPAWTAADALTALRLPMAVAFVGVDHAGWRAGILGAAAASDLLDGHLARRYGGSPVGAVLDPVADKLFMLAAFAVVLLEDALTPWEVAGALARDIVATAAFVLTTVAGRTVTTPARLAGKIVTAAQVATLAAFLAGSPLVRPLAWLTAALAAVALLDYLSAVRAAPRPS